MRESGAKIYTGGMTPLLPGNPLNRFFLVLVITVFLPGMKARGVIGTDQSLSLGTFHFQLCLFINMPVSLE